MFELIREKALCAHCRKPVTKNDLVMWVDGVEPFEIYLVHRKVVNSKCDPAITKFLNDLYPDRPELTEHIDTVFEMFERILKKNEQL
jgi:hypothetical protein